MIDSIMYIAAGMITLLITIISLSAPFLYSLFISVSMLIIVNQLIKMRTKDVKPN